MKVIAYGDIMDRGQSVFTSVATLDRKSLKITFGGMLRVDSPARHLAVYMDELGSALDGATVEHIEFDFRELSFCNSNGFYVIMDITELVVNQFDCPISVKRLSGDDWHQETLPILLNAEEPAIRDRLSLEQYDQV